MVTRLGPRWNDDTGHIPLGQSMGEGMTEIEWAQLRLMLAYAKLQAISVAAVALSLACYAFAIARFPEYAWCTWLTMPIAYYLARHNTVRETREAERKLAAIEEAHLRRFHSSKS